MGWLCAQCRKAVPPAPRWTQDPVTGLLHDNAAAFWEPPLPGSNQVYPSSKYWNHQRREVFCGPECSTRFEDDLRRVRQAIKKGNPCG